MAPRTSGWCEIPPPKDTHTSTRRNTLATQRLLKTKDRAGSARTAVVVLKPE